MGAPKSNNRAGPKPGSLHLDRRAASIIEASVGSDDDLLDTEALADWLGISTQWLEIGRHKGRGPRFTKLSSRCVRYRRSDVLAWLKARTISRTSEYKKRA